MGVGGGSGKGAGRPRQQQLPQRGEADELQLALDYLLALCRAGLGTGRQLRLVLAALPAHSAAGDRPRAAELMEAVVGAGGGVMQRSGWLLAVHHGWVIAGDLSPAMAGVRSAFHRSSPPCTPFATLGSRRARPPSPAESSCPPQPSGWLQPNRPASKPTPGQPQLQLERQRFSCCWTAAVQLWRRNTSTGGWLSHHRLTHLLSGSSLSAASACSVAAPRLSVLRLLRAPLVRAQAAKRRPGRRRAFRRAASSRAGRRNGSASSFAGCGRPVAGGPGPDRG